jgi:hypothetical protein
MPTLELYADQSAIRRILRTISDALFWRGRGSAGQPPPERERPGRHGNAEAEPCPVETIRRRLTEQLARLEQLDAERERRGDSRFGKSTEDRIVWGELIELELQDIDEQVSRICGAAGRSLRAPVKSNLREGGPHERDDS